MRSVYAALDYTAAVLIAVVFMVFVIAVVPIVVAVDIYRLARKR